MSAAEPLYGTPAEEARTPYEVRLRPLEAADLQRVVVLEQELFGRGAWTYGMLAEELGGWGRWYVAAEPDPPDAVGPQDVVGYAGSWFDDEVVQIMTIGVDPAFQQRGIGRALLEALLDRARAVGAQAVLLEVRVDNGPAIGLYESYGFVQIAVRKKYYQPEGVDAFVMRLEVDGPQDAPVAPVSPGPVGA